MNALIKELKDNDQDFEFYPTTDEITFDFYKRIKEYTSILDIGAGNGSLFKRINKFNKPDKNGYKNNFDFYAIEKSQILINQMEPNIFIIGTDFHQQSLIDKKMNVIFCNPPYSEYEQWAVKIIEQANSKAIYMVMPERWSNSEKIKLAIKDRKISTHIIGTYDFLEGDRPARGNVNLVQFLIPERLYRDDNKDPFTIWFDKTFKFEADEEDKPNYKQAEEKTESLKELVAGYSLIPRLTELYNNEMMDLFNSYKAIEKIKPDLLKELGVSKENLTGGLKQKIEDLKNVYWHELFNNLDKITDKLTHGSRENLLNTLTDNTNIDFTANNAYAVVIWVIKNANKYFDSQLITMYRDITEEKAMIKYKSNVRFLKDEWRWCKKQSHYKLDYRIVTQRHCWEDRYSSGLKFTENARTFLDDITTIANNLGFTAHKKPYHFWDRLNPGEAFELRYYKDGESNILAECKTYKNGNIHIKFNQEFMKAFNIEAGRLNKWLKDPKHAAEETGYNIKDIAKYFRSNLNLLPNDIMLLEHLATPAQ